MEQEHEIFFLSKIMSTYVTKLSIDFMDFFHFLFVLGWELNIGLHKYSITELYLNFPILKELVYVKYVKINHLMLLLFPGWRKGTNMY